MWSLWYPERWSSWKLAPPVCVSIPKTLSTVWLLQHLGHLVWWHSDSKVMQQKMPAYLKKGTPLKSTENLLAQVVGLTLPLTDWLLGRKETNFIMWLIYVHQSQYILFNPSKPLHFSSKNEISYFKSYCQEVEKPCKTMAVWPLRSMLFLYQQMLLWNSLHFSDLLCICETEMLTLWIN